MVCYKVYSDMAQVFSENYEVFLSFKKKCGKTPAGYSDLVLKMCITDSVVYCCNSTFMFSDISGKKIEKISIRPIFEIFRTTPLS